MLMPKLKKPNLNSLNGNYILSPDMRTSLRIPEGILTGECGHWRDAELLVSDYFLSTAHPSKSSKDVLAEIIASLQTIHEAEPVKKHHLLLKNYANGVMSYLQNADTQKMFHLQFKSKLLELQLSSAKKSAMVQGQITGYKLSEIGALLFAEELDATDLDISNVPTTTTLIDSESITGPSSSEQTNSATGNLNSLTRNPDSEDSGATVRDQNDTEADAGDDTELRSKRPCFSSSNNTQYQTSEDNPFLNSIPRNESITIIKDNNIYNIQTPSKNVNSPNKPALQRHDVEQLEDFIDVCIDLHTKVKCSAPLYQLFKGFSNDRSNNTSLKKLNVFEYAKDVLKVDNRDDYDDEVGDVPCGRKANPVFKKFIKKVLCEFALNSTRPVKYDIDDERTIYVEMFVPIFKLFALITKKLVFSWCERSLNNASSIWIVDSDYKKAGVVRKLLDGIGSLVAEDISWLLIESSGFSKNQKYKHTIEDCLKNIKNGTDSLKFIMSKYKNASIDTMKKVKIFSIQIIQTKLTLLCYQLQSREKWQVVECASANMPLIWSKRKMMLTVLELFAYLYLELLEQEHVHVCLTDEQLGFSPVNVEYQVATYLNEREL